jgi:hypothetical protein
MSSGTDNPLCTARLCRGYKQGQDSSSPGGKGKQGKGKNGKSKAGGKGKQQYVNFSAGMIDCLCRAHPPRSAWNCSEYSINRPT